MLFLFGLIVHILSIATLFPEIAEKALVSQEIVVAIQFPLMALASVMVIIWDDPDDVMRTRLANFSLTFGITYVCIFLLATFGISVGPANPFAAPEESLKFRAAWFVGFSIITSFGARFFIAKSVLGIVGAFDRTIRQAPMLWILIALVLGAGMGYGAILLLESEMVATLISKTQSEMEENPAPYILGIVFVPIALAGIARALRGNRRPI